MDTFEKAKAFVYRNARPLDLARWRFHFENGSRDDVLNVLSMYQNPDGGFGWALEPDFWNPNSTPIATWAATNILRELDLAEESHPVLRGILRYLDSGNDFVDGKWCNTVPGNNDHPHAVWWTCNRETGIPSDNPTVSLAGFGLRFSPRDSSLYRKCASIGKEAVDRFLAEPVLENHTLRCYLELLAWCEDIRDFDLFDLNVFRSALYSAIRATVCAEPEKWYTEYVTKPSFFFDKSNRLFQIMSPELCAQEAKRIPQQQLSDGAWPVTWQWWTEYKEYEISANWWKSSFCIDNLLYLKYCEKPV